MTKPITKNTNQNFHIYIKKNKFTNPLLKEKWYIYNIFTTNYR